MGAFYIPGTVSSNYAYVFLVTCGAILSLKYISESVDSVERYACSERLVWMKVMYVVLEISFENKDKITL